MFFLLVCTTIHIEHSLVYIMGDSLLSSRNSWVNSYRYTLANRLICIVLYCTVLCSVFALHPFGVNIDRERWQYGLPAYCVVFKGWASAAWLILQWIVCSPYNPKLAWCRVRLCYSLYIASDSIYAARQTAFHRTGLSCSLPIPRRQWQSETCTPRFSSAGAYRWMCGLRSTYSYSAVAVQ